MGESPRADVVEATNREPTPQRPVTARQVTANGGRTLTEKGQRSRARLLEAAREIFARDGFQGTRITDIADAAGAAHGSFYTYFDSKEAIFLALLEELEDELMGWGAAAGDGARSEGPYEQIRRRNFEYLKYYVESGKLMVVWEQVATLNDEVAELRYEATMRFVRRVEASIARLQSEGEADKTLDPYYAAHALAGMVSRFAYSWVLRDEPFELERAADQLTRLWTNAVGLSSNPRGTEST